MKADVIREKFLEFFKGRGHKVVPSASLVPVDDPTLLFTGAGMNQFKDYFLGLKKDYKRAASSQKCFRTGDIEKVGRTPAHHTFFEMLGNFSFGDYFKQEAIQWAWEFMTQELAIDKNRLWVSVYKDDHEACGIWLKKVKVLPEKIVKLGDKDNFWPSQCKEKGPNGPCGPCSEIFFDQGSDIGCGRQDCTPMCDCGRFVEVWNLVFTQFNRKDGGILEPLPMKNIDTGMGLERITAVMQGVRSNFQTDLFAPIINAIEEFANDEIRTTNNGIYTIADHIRAAVFLIADGVLPSNEGRGYVERMVIRRAARLGEQLGIEGPFLYKLVPAVAMVMKKPYPQISARRENCAQVLLAEEERFSRTLREGERLLEDLMAKNKSKTLKGEDVFRLYDTYGFPLDLTEQIAQEKGFSVDRDGFKNAMAAQKDMSRKSSVISSEIFAQTLTQKIQGLANATDFVGYQALSCEGKVVAILKDGAPVSSVKETEEALLILDKTPFYGSSGGQAGDAGRIIKIRDSKLKDASITDAILDVIDTKRFDKVIAHVCKVKNGSVGIGDAVMAEVDKQRREDIAKNHTATHLLQAALRKVLGGHVRQSGSLVAPDRLRFDFTHFKALSVQQLERVENLVGENIKKDDAVVVKPMRLEDAVADGAIALFSEKYEENVRGIYIGNYSKELCGGTHIETTGKIGAFKITGESSISAGTRRIEAITGRFAAKAADEQKRALKEASGILDIQLESKAAAENIQAFQDKIGRLNSRLDKFKRKAFVSRADEIISEGKDIKGVKVVIAEIKDADIGALRSIADSIRQKVDPSAVLLAACLEDKVWLLAAFTKGLVKKGLDAGKIIKDVAGIVGGSGGGRQDLAQAGGKDAKKLKDAFRKFEEILRGSI